MCVQEPCVYLLHAASTVIRNSMAESAVALSGGRNFYSCITLTGCLLEEKHSVVVHTGLDPKRTSYGFGYGFPWSLAGLILCLLGITCPCPAATAQARPQAWQSPPSSTTSFEGVVFAIKYPSWAQPYIINRFIFFAVPGYERAQVATVFPLTMLGGGGQGTALTNDNLTHILCPKLFVPRTFHP